MKKFQKIVSIFLGLFVTFFAFVGCSSGAKVSRVAKKLTTYSIDAVFCDSEKKITAIEQVDFINNTETILSSVCFNLYGKAFSEDAKIKPYSKAKIDECFPNGINYGDMNIQEVFVGGQSATYNIVGEDQNALEVLLNEPLYGGERVEIVVHFELFLANCTHRLGYSEGKVNLGNWYPVVAVYENGKYDISPYYSNGDPFYSECANYNVTLTYDDVYNLSATGDFVNLEEEGGKIRASYTALAVRDFAMVLLLDCQTKTIEVDDTVVSVTAKSNDTNIDIYLETAKRSLELFNEKFGKYPYKTLNVVFTDFCQGGMEYPNLVYISNSVTVLEEIKKVIVHEIAHQWWYGIVGNNEVTTAWFDEGLAEYSTLIYYECYQDEGVDVKKLISDAKISYELYLDVIKTLNIDINYCMALPLNEYLSEYEYVYMVYVKGLLFFDSLRQAMGDELFFKCLHDIYTDYQFKTINKEEFIASVEKSSKMNLTELIEGWLSGNVDI